MVHGSESSNPVLSFLLYASVIKQGDSELWVKGEYHDNFAAVRKVSRDNLSRAKQPRLFNRTDWLEKLYEHCLSGYPPLFLRARAEGPERPQERRAGQERGRQGRSGGGREHSKTNR